jgi:hypothetical protein
MKKLLLFSAALASTLALTAQPIQRKALIEEWTSATCGPCASQNPAFNALIGPNRDVKVVPVKYQVPIPSAGDPMYAQNMPESDARRSYYGVNSAPMTRMNGFTPDNNNTTGGNWTGYAGGPYGYTQAVLDAEFNNLTSFSLVLDHWVSEDLDTVYATITITNVDTVAVNNPNLLVRAALLEETITFTTAPGSNGETTFEEVMRKMVPNATGTAVSATWAPGQSEVISIEAPIPNYIYDYTELSMSAWLQDDATKEVLQADYNDPATVQGNDAALVLNTLNAGLCSNSISPEVSLTNEGTETVTSIDIQVSVNGAVQGSETWTGSLAAGASAAYSLTGTYSVGAGSNDVEVSITAVNGGVDLSNANNIGSETAVVVSSTPMEYPFLMDAEGLSFEELPSYAYGENPTGFLFGAISNADVNGLPQNLGAYENSISSIFWYFYGANAGAYASFTLDPVDLTDANNANLTFSHAYAQYTTEDDRFEIEVSDDCGATWNTLFNEAGAALSTTPATTANFWPTASQWETTEISLASYVGSELIFRFTGTSQYGNNLFIDDIGVTVPTIDTTTTVIDGETVYIIDGDTFELVNGNYYPLTIADVDGVNVTVFPNPANDFVTVTGVNGLATVMIYDAMGRMVSNTTLNNNVLSVSELKAGVYTLVIENNGAVLNERITVIH